MTATRSSLLGRVRDPADVHGWREFDGLYRPLLVDYARARGLPTVEAEEVAQECMVAIAQVMHRFQKQRSFRGWLRGMVRRKVADHIGRRRKTQRADTELLADLPDEREPDEVWQESWNRAHVHWCLDHLRGEFAPHTLRAFVMYVLQEMPVEEIGRSLHMTPNQIYVAKSRVLSKLRAMADDIRPEMYDETP